MEYYVVLMRMSQIPILKSKGSPKAAEDEIWATARKRAAETLSHAVIRLETVIRLYYLRHSFEFCDTYMTYPLWTLANTLMKAKSGRQMAVFHEAPDSLEHLRSTLVLCLRGLADQSRHAHMAGVIFRLLFERQTPEDADIIGRYIPLDILEDRSAMDHPVRSACPLHADGANENPDMSRPEDLANKHSLEQWVAPSGAKSG